MSYAARRQWSDNYLEAVRCALGKKFFAASSRKDDTQFGIDLYIPELKLAVRIRNSRYSVYGDFTLRTSVPKGYKSEYAKLLDKDNNVDFLFYGYSLDKNNLAAGYLIDINALKTAIILGEAKPKFRRNKDGSHFIILPLLPVFTEQIL